MKYFILQIFIISRMSFIIRNFTCDFGVILGFLNLILNSGPSLMDFGQVCLRSVSSKDLMIVNNLDIYIHVVVQVGECLIPCLNLCIYRFGVRWLGFMNLSHRTCLYYPLFFNPCSDQWKKIIRRSMHIIEISLSPFVTTK